MAVATLVLAASGAHAGGADSRDLNSHVIIGVSPDVDFDVLADGDAVPDSPVTSDGLGIVEFSVDLPPGPHSISVGPAGSIPDPPVISNLRADDVTTTTAVIRWDTDVPTNARVVYGTTPEYGGDTGFTSEYETSHATQLSGLEPATLYHYRVQNRDAHGQPVWSGDMTFETDPEPLEMNDVRVSMLGPTWAVIEWDTNRPSTSQVEYGITDSYGEETLEDDNPVLGHTVTLTGLLEGTEYHYRVVSRDAYDVTALSPDDTFTTHDPEPTGPPIIGDVTFIAESMTSVIVSWNTDRESSSCVCYGTKGELDHATVADTTGVTNHFVRVGPVAPDHLYTFVVLSACGADTAVSEEHTFMAESPVGTTMSGKAVTISKPGAICVTDTTATIAWSTDRACTTWVEYGDDDNWDSPAFPVRSEGECHEVCLTGLAPGTVYYFRVCAWDEFGGRVDVDGGTFETCVYPDMSPPGVPSDLLVLPRNGVVELTWTPCPDDDLLGYYVYRVDSKTPDVPGEGFDGGRAMRLNELPLSGADYVDNTALESFGYVYAVTSVDEAGNESEPCDGVFALVVPPASGEVEVGALHLVVGLNPCYGVTTFDYAVPHGERASMRIYSIGGRLIRDLTPEMHSKDAGAVTWKCRDGVSRPVGTGVFVCELACGEDVVRSKVTVLR